MVACQSFRLLIIEVTIHCNLINEGFVGDGITWVGNYL